VAVKNPALVALPDKMKDALRLINARFGVDWDDITVTTGVQAIKLLDDKASEQQAVYYRQNTPRKLLTIEERQEAAKLEVMTLKEAAKQLKLKNSRLEAEKLMKAQLKQVALF
jgi:hypothetical protein